MVIRDRLKCCQRVSGAFFGIMVGSAPGTRFSQTLLKTQERVKTHTGAILVCFFAAFCLYCQIALIPLNFCFSAPVPSSAFPKV